MNFVPGYCFYIKTKITKPLKNECLKMKTKTQKNNAGEQ